MNPADSAAVALRGASLAFRGKEKLDQVPLSQKRQSQQSQQSSNASGRHNGAYTAAAQVGRSTTSSPASSARGPQATEQGSVVEVVDSRQTQKTQQGLVAARAYNHQVGTAAATPNPSSHLGLAAAAGAGRVDAKSPSRIAAELAASRSASPTSASRTVRRKGSVGGASSASSRASSSASEAAVVDSGSIAPTGSLISIFERARGGGGTGERAVPLRPSPPESTGSCPEERPGGPGRPGKASLGKSKPRLNTRPPTPPLPTQAAVTPSKPPSAGLSRSGSAAASPNPPRPGPTHSMPPSTPKAPSSQSPQSHIVSPPSLPASHRRPMTPTSIPSSTHPSTPGTLSAKKPPPSPLPGGIRRSNTVATTPKTRSTGHLPSTPRSQTPPPVMGRSMAEVLSPQPKRVSKTPLSSVKPPHLTLSPLIHTTSSPSSDPQKRSSTTKRAPTPPKPRRGATRDNLDAPSSRVMDASIGEALRRGGKSMSPAPGRQAEPRPSPPLHAWRHSIVSAPPSPTREGSRRRSTNTSASNLHLESLADAIVAGSLASARLTPHSTGSTLALPPPSLPKRQRSPRLLQTLRQPVSLSDEESDRHKKGHHRPKLHKGKHAHHEGSRKKWREEIRPRERKRYDALWASNRGLLLTPQATSPSASVAGSSSSSSSVVVVVDRDDLSQYVANVVVREIWRRSRLPVDELAEIWDLVDREGLGMLSRQEFAVGTWLVDQRLRGRKVPAKVTDSVWGSANGVTVRKPKRR